MEFRKKFTLVWFCFGGLGLQLIVCVFICMFGNKCLCARIFYEQTSARKCEWNFKGREESFRWLVSLSYEATIKARNWWSPSIRDIDLLFGITDHRIRKKARTTKGNATQRRATTSRCLGYNRVWFIFIARPLICLFN